MPEPEIKCLIWDVGGTILECDANLTCQVLARWSGKDSKVVQQIIYGQFHSKLSPLYHLECGRVDEDEFLIMLRHLLKIGDEIPDRAIGEVFVKYTNLSGRIRTLLHYLRGQGFLQGLLSNNNPLCRYTLDSFPTLALECDQNMRGGVMDFHVFSYIEGVVKPRLLIFRRALKRARAAQKIRFKSSKLSPQECLFFDDREENIVAARRIGLNACLVKKPEDIFEGLLAYSILLPPDGWKPDPIYPPHKR